MKVLLLTLALVALAYSQTCKIERAWSQFQTTSKYSLDPQWEDKELIGWGMDGDNKWQDFWRRTDEFGVSNYDRITCNLAATPTANPAYVMTCGDCSMSGSSCNCYPYYDVAGSYQQSASPESSGSNSEPEAPPGWASGYANPNPPYEVIDTNDDDENKWTLENCKQYQPGAIYYYTYRLRLNKDNVFTKSLGISSAFEPSKKKWANFCDRAFTGSNYDSDDTDSRYCYVPTGSGDEEDDELFGAFYNYQKGVFREGMEFENDNRISFNHYQFERGCHMKAYERTYPTAAFCGDSSGWTFGAGATAHVRFGCDTSTFQDTATDAFDIDDGDCASLYLQFDQMNPLTSTVDVYGPAVTPGNDVGQTQGPANPQDFLTQYGLDAIQFVRSPVADFNDVENLGGACWYKSSFIDHRTGVPSYRTPCSAGVLAVPFLALLSTLFVALRNLF